MSKTRFKVNIAHTDDVQPTFLSASSMECIRSVSQCLDAIGGCACVLPSNDQLAMHKALMIPEVVATICINFVHIDNEFDPGLVHVASGAFGLAFGLASKAHLLELCLDALWTNVSFARLIKCLPINAWRQQKQSGPLVSEYSRLEQTLVV
jgi:hypothetical protein